MKDMGIRPIADPECVRRGVEKILYTLDKLDGANTATFFTTGQVARNQSNLVNRLAQEGHEIACHTNDHENCFDLTLSEFEDNIKKAVYSLEESAQQKIVGFRAPDFSVNERCPWTYEVLAANGFLYDSSTLKGGQRNQETEYDSLIVTGQEFFKFPLYSFNIIWNINIRIIGGSYFRLLPSFVILKLMRKAVENGYTPIVYLHPSDIDDKFSPILMSQMTGLGLGLRLKWGIHQKLWSTGTESSTKKLEIILQEFPNKGPLVWALPR